MSASHSPGFQKERERTDQIREQVFELLRDPGLWETSLVRIRREVDRECVKRGIFGSFEPGEVPTSYGDRLRKKEARWNAFSEPGPGTLHASGAPGDRPPLDE